MPRMVALAVVVATSAVSVEAQERRPVCFHPRRLDHCRAFPVLELTVTATAFSTAVRGGVGRDFPPALSGTVGGMVNFTRWFAVGGQFVRSWAQEFGNAYEGRARVWTGGVTAVDVSVGYATSLHEEPFNAAPMWDGRTRGRGPTASVAFVPIEYLSFVARARSVRDEEGQKRTGLMFGVQTGSWGTLSILGVAAMLGVVYLAGGGASN